MVTCQSSEIGWEVTVELPADFLSLRRGSVSCAPLQEQERKRISGGSPVATPMPKLVLSSREKRSTG